MTSIGVTLGADTYVTCHVYTDRTPILHISRGGTILTLSLDHDRIPSDEDLKAVRDLIDAVLVFGAEVERHACGAPSMAAS